MKNRLLMAAATLLASGWLTQDPRKYARRAMSVDPVETLTAE
jgi:hypothetical protein